MKSVVSVIVPVYNVERYLAECVDSILGQTYPQVELILVDDGSTDGSGRICDEYAKADPRVRVIHQPNAGAANAKNAGLDAATGVYIAFVDSDDWVEPDWLERMVLAAAEQDADVVECSFRMEYVDRWEWGNAPEEFVHTNFSTKDYLRHYLTRWTCALFWNKLFRAKLLARVRFHTERRCIDDEFFTYKAVTGASRVLRIPEALYHYRQRRSSVTQRENTLYQRTADDIDILVERYQWIKGHYPDIAMDYLRHDVDTLLYFAREYPFDQTAIAGFRKTARFYLRECLRRYPGKVTAFYAWKAASFRKKGFKTAQDCERTAADEERYYL